MTTLSFYVTDDGKLPIGIKEAMKNLVPTYAGKKCRLTIVEAKDHRSLDQNAYYRGVVLVHVRKVMEECGDVRSADAWHELLIEEFSPLVEYTTLHGEIKMRHMRTHEMDVEYMARFITAISAEMAQRGAPVPIMEDMYKNQR